MNPHSIDTDRKGFSLYNSDQPAFPILLSVPHAGRIYSPTLLDHLRVLPEELVRLEDRYADRLVQNAIAAGMPAIIAHQARAWIDLNRAEDDIDPDMILGRNRSDCVPSAKARGGLGLIPRRLGGCGELWRGPHDWADVEQRIQADYRPYHLHIETTLKQMRDRFGVAILLDVHSMPPLSEWNKESQPRIVVGDRYGKSAQAIYAETIMDVVRQHGIAPALNHPYPGDHMLRRHGQPQRNIHAIQLEVDRSLYLDDLLRELGPGLADITGLLSDIAFALNDQAAGKLAVAAE
jgi:N-formylglutamate amidohydrolase